MISTSCAYNAFLYNSFLLLYSTIYPSIYLSISNVLVTMLNKASFATVDFKYPYALSAMHMVCNIIGAESYLLLNT